MVNIFLRKSTLRSLVLFSGAVMFSPWVIQLVTGKQLHGASFELPLFYSISTLVFAVFFYFTPLSVKECLKSSGNFHLLVFFSGAIFIFITNPLWVGQVQVLHLGLVLLLLYWLLRTFVTGVVRNTAMKPLRRNLLSGLAGLAFLFFVAEGIFLFIPLTVGSTLSLSSRLWFEWYWNPINEAGYRDIPLAENKGGFRILFVGDSFPAGQGIKNIEDRFPDLMRKYLSPGISVYNLGDCGADVERNFANLKSFPVKPDMVILSWFINDLDGAAKEAGLPFVARDLDGTPEPFRFLLLRSYFLNYIYSLRPFGHDFGYSDWLKKITADPNVRQIHQQSLQKVADWCKNEKVNLKVVLFPVLTDPDAFHSTLEETEQFLRSQGIETLDLTPVVKSLPVEKRRVNRNDDHPGEELHQLVAQAIDQWLKASGGLPQ